MNTNICFSLQVIIEMFLILRIIQRDTVINVKNLHVKYKLFLSDFNEVLIPLTGFRKILTYEIS